MAKQKAPTPQELYRQRRLREEQERTAYLPPGLINHGNTCFMNSVLQGLIATRLLSDLVHFAPIPPGVQERATTLISSKRSPQLTNGHNLAGPYEQKWVNSMPIGDVFLNVMYKGWELQAKRQREILSPRTILNALGRKYDQYLDFAQQDAHEFLRILLDAMRMEEQDIIKKRQPPPPQTRKKRRRSTLVPDAPLESPPQIPEDEKLMSFVDMIFEGRLTSILVCQKCKHISQTYEDFNDISLSIKPEDYIHRKRNRLKNFAKRLTNFPAFVVPEMQRSSSVPPTPKERPDGQLINHEDSPPPSTVRRKSMEFHPADSTAVEDDHPATGDANAETNAAEVEGTHVLVNVTGPEGKHVEFVEVSINKIDGSDKEKDKEKEKKKKEHEDNNWTKLGRRLSMTVGLGKPKDKDKKSRSHHRVSAPIIEGVPLDVSEDPIPDKTQLHPPRASMTSALESSASRSSSLQLPLTESPRPSLDSRAPPSLASSLNGSTSSYRNGKDPKEPPRSKSPKPPKPTPAESEYLRKILADVDTGASSNPFSIFKPQGHSSTGKTPNTSATSPLSHHNLWLGVKTLSGIEECLRMFTAVEVLDGENMVGCRRCWKIANGQLPKSKHGVKTEGHLDEDDSDSVGQESSPSTQDNDFGVVVGGSDSKALTSPPLQHTIRARPPPLPHIQPVVHIPTSISTPTVSYYAHYPEVPDKSDSRSISSLPTGVSSTSVPEAESSNQSSTTSRRGSQSDSSVDSTPGGLPIPVISTTAPEGSEHSTDGDSSVNEVSTSDHDDSDPGGNEHPLRNGIVSPRPVRPANFNHVDASVLGSKDCLPVPPRTVRRRKAAGDVTTTDDESSGDETDTSIATSVSADSVNTHSPAPLTNGAQLSNSISRSNGATAPSASSPAASSSQPSTSKKTSKPKPVIMRPAYKRYLIATPPPVLVIHLKRFQQLMKSPFLSFSNGFKKLDDYVTFPEYLDLTPFLAPKKEDYGLGKKKKGKGTSSKVTQERCMYRLYAVVVHIGNMLGGHYIAYTALPTQSPTEGEGLATKGHATTGPASDAAPQAARADQPEQQPSDYSANPFSSSASVRSGSTSQPSIPASSTQSSTTSTSSQPRDPPAERQWAYISDTIVRLTTLEEVLNAKAYICMYERC